MFAFSGLSYVQGISGSRHYTYDTPDEIDEVMSPGYLTDVQEIFAAGDTLDINAADRRMLVPILSPEMRWAPSAEVH